MKGHVAVAEIRIDASPARVWRALTDPAEIEQYMLGSKVETNWELGSRIVWKGEYEGKNYEDHGKVIECEPEKRLVVTHFSPLNGDEDAPENYHTITYEVDESKGGVRVSLSQDNNSTLEAAEHSKANWEKVLAGLKAVVEKSQIHTAETARN